MTYLLCASGVLMMIGSVILLAFRSAFLAPNELTPLLHVLANGWGLSMLVLAVTFFRAASEPQRHLSAVAAAMLIMTFKTANDLYGMLVLPPMLALALVADLVLSVGLLVGMLRELPGTIELARHARADQEKDATA